MLSSYKILVEFMPDDNISDDYTCMICSGPGEDNRTFCKEE